MDKNELFKKIDEMDEEERDVVFGHILKGVAEQFEKGEFRGMVIVVDDKCSMHFITSASMGDIFRYSDDVAKTLIAGIIESSERLGDDVKEDFGAVIKALGSMDSKSCKGMYV